MAKRCTLAHALHQSGNPNEASQQFEEAESLQIRWKSESATFYSLRGYRYCDLLLSKGGKTEVLRRATQSLGIAERKGWLLDIGLDHLSLSRVYSPGSVESTCHLDQAVDFLRRSGQLDFLPLALLARGTPQDLEEAFRIATRSGMRLHLADYHLAKGNLEEAERLINETGYHRRDPELAALRAKYQDPKN